MSNVCSAADTKPLGLEPRPWRGCEAVRVIPNNAARDSVYFSGSGVTASRGVPRRGAVGVIASHRTASWNQVSRPQPVRPRLLLISKRVTARCVALSTGRLARVVRSPRGALTNESQEPRRQARYRADTAVQPAGRFTGATAFRRMNYERNA